MLGGRTTTDIKLICKSLDCRISNQICFWIKAAMTWWTSSRESTSTWNKKTFQSTTFRRRTSKSTPRQRAISEKAGANCRLPTNVYMTRTCLRRPIRSWSLRLNLLTIKMRKISHYPCEKYKTSKTCEDRSYCLTCNSSWRWETIATLQAVKRGTKQSLLRRRHPWMQLRHTK